MDNILQLLLPLIVVILTFVLGNRRKKAERQRTQENERHDDAPPDNEVALPPFMESFPFETETLPDFLETEETEPAHTVEEPAPPPNEEPPPMPPEPRTPARTGTKPLPTTVLPDLSPQTFRQGIILSEILGRPKARRTRNRI